MFKITKPILLLITAIAIPICSFCQIKETIDRDINLIKYVPYGKCPFKDNRKLNRRYRKRNHEYREILALDTLAIPYLVDKISDTTQTDIRIPCAAQPLKVGDVAFALLNDIILIPWSAATGSQWDSYGCDSLPDGGWDYLRNDREKFKQELKTFFGSKKGKIWVKLFKVKLSKAEWEELSKQLVKELAGT